MPRNDARTERTQTTPVEENAGRGAMSLTISDLQVLHELCRIDRDETAKPSLKQVAERVGTQRTLLYRLIARANEQIGFPELKWSDRSEGFYVPPEIHRLTQGLFAGDGFLSGCCFPCVSAGSSALVLLTELILKLKLPAPRLSYSRSEDSLSALLDREIDLALIHEFDDAPKPLADELERQILIPWESRLVRPADLALSKCRSVEWEPESFAWQLTKQSVRRPRSLPSMTAIRLTGYSHGLEVMRRGHALTFVVPSLYLRDDDRQRLRIEATPHRITGRLVAISRKQDRSRLAPWLAADDWSALVSDKTLS